MKSWTVRGLAAAALATVAIGAYTLTTTVNTIDARAAMKKASKLVLDVDNVKKTSWHLSADGSTHEQTLYIAKDRTRLEGPGGGYVYKDGERTEWKTSPNAIVSGSYIPLEMEVRNLSQDFSKMLESNQFSNPRDLGVQDGLRRLSFDYHYDQLPPRYGGAQRWVYYLSEQTGLLVKVEFQEFHNEGWEATYIGQYEYNIDMPESLFEPPAK